jgi:hypothetical protein
MIKLELTEQYFQTIGYALGELPFKLSAPVIQELQKQVQVKQISTEVVG